MNPPAQRSLDFNDYSVFDEEATAVPSVQASNSTMDYSIFDELAPTTPAPAVASTPAPDLLDQTPSSSYVHDRSRLNLGPAAHDPF